MKIILPSRILRVKTHLTPTRLLQPWMEGWGDRWVKRKTLARILRAGVDAPIRVSYRHHPRQLSCQVIFFENGGFNIGCQVFDPKDAAIVSKWAAGALKSKRRRKA